jgi:hypothetical protein
MIKLLRWCYWLGENFISCTFVVLNPELRSAVGVGMFNHAGTPVRTASVRARGICRLWAIERKDYAKLAARFPQEDALFQDFFLIVDEIQRVENTTRAFDWDRSRISLG